MASTTTEQARFNMVQQQIRPWNVFDQRVLNVLDELPRDTFVPEKYRGLAYADTEIPLGGGEQMMFPRMEARLLQALDIQPEDKILEIGTGSGYLTACLAKLGKSVISIDINSAMTDQARFQLEAQGIANVELRTGDGV
ncbi:MAG: protein-L-isoaspartate O-methyltransferase, partial [Gammaproteobacteria bacterium]|nr:protein-L-isoaspartate O-methyltransferase [Gammaproteobacteria bacterium]